MEGRSVRKGTGVHLYGASIALWQPTLQPRASHEELRVFRWKGGRVENRTGSFDFPLEVSLPPSQNPPWQLLPTVNYLP